MNPCERQLDEVLTNILAPAVARLRNDKKNQRLLIQKGQSNQSRVFLNGERFRYQVTADQHLLTSERKVLKGAGKQPVLTIKLAGDTLTYENKKSGSHLEIQNGNSSTVGMADSIFFELYQLAFR